MNEFVEQVTEFQRTFDPRNVSVDKMRLEHMRWPESSELLDLRQKLINEEVNELNSAIAMMMGYLNLARYHKQSMNTQLKKCPNYFACNWYKAKREFADALGDILVVVIGTALACGLDIEEIMRRIHTSNMSKLGEDGKPIYREDGKVMKGPFYAPPKLGDLIW